MRGPTTRELALLRSLLTGPRQVLDGPLGQCAKRGWCAMVEMPGRLKGPCRYGLTPAGLAALCDAR